jgi:hypothetical protein
MREKLELSSDGGDSGSKKCKRSSSGAYGGSLRFAGMWSLESGGKFYAGALHGNLASVAIVLIPFSNGV